MVKGLENAVGVAAENVTRPELESRWARCRALLQATLPAAGGLLLFSRLNIYYGSGTFANGLLWLPLAGEPVLLCRRGYERARLESPLLRIQTFRSYKEVEHLLREAGSPLSKTVAVEMNGLSWALGASFAKYLPGYELRPGDGVIARTRAVKSEWELARLRLAGAKHDLCLRQLLPPMLHEGISELEIAHLLSELFFSQGHYGLLRMESYGEEVYQGHIAVGESGNYPSVFNGPLGLRGAHPAVPHMGSAAVRWQAGAPLTIDNGFSIAGYQSDKTLVYWLGKESEIPAEMRAAHAFCQELQGWVAGQLRPGMRPSEIWQYCRGLANDRGWGAGFMGLGHNQVNFVGHGIGLAIDEYPVLAEGFDLPLEVGMVLAVEPKIGIPGLGMVGVENTFEVTAGGGKSLTGDQDGVICIG